MGNSALAAVLPSIARETGISEFASGLILSASPIAYFFAAPFWGKKADQIGSTRILTFGLAGYAIGILPFALSVSSGLQSLLSGYVLVSAMVASRVINSTLGAGPYPAAIALVAAGSADSDRVQRIAASGFGSTTAFPESSLR